MSAETPAPVPPTVPAIPTPAAPSAPPRRSPWRSIAAGICLVLSFVLTIPALLGYWGQRTLTDPQRYLATVAPVASDPQVQAAVAEVINKNLQEKLDVDSLLKQWLPQEAQPLAGPLAGAIDSFISREVNDFIASDAFEQLWIAVNSQAQKALIAALSADQKGPVEIQGDKVVLDLGDVITEVKARLVAKGLTMLQNVPVPAAADREIVLLQSEELAQVRTIYAVSVPVARWLLLLVFLLWAGAVLLARRRPRMLVAVGGLLIISMFFLRQVLRVAETYLANSAPDSVLAAGERAFFNHMTTYLVSAVMAGYMVGFLMVLFGWLFGRTRAAVVTRGALNRAIADAGKRVGTLAPVAAAGAWVAPKAKILVAVIIAIGAVVLVMQNQWTAGLLAVLTLCVVLAVLVVLILAAAGHPDPGAAAEPEPAEAQPAEPTPAA